MKIDTSFNSAFLQLQNGVNDARKAASNVLESVGSEKNRALDLPEAKNSADRKGSGGVNVTA